MQEETVLTLLCQCDLNVKSLLSSDPMPSLKQHSFQPWQLWLSLPWLGRVRYQFFQNNSIQALPGGSGEPMLQEVLHKEGCWQSLWACSWIWQDDLCKGATRSWHHPPPLPRGLLTDYGKASCTKEATADSVKADSVRGWSRLCCDAKPQTPGRLQLWGRNSLQVAGITSPEMLRSLMRHKCPTSSRQLCQDVWSVPYTAQTKEEGIKTAS